MLVLETLSFSAYPALTSTVDLNYFLLPHARAVRIQTITRNKPEPKPKPQSEKPLAPTLPALASRQITRLLPPSSLLLLYKQNTHRPFHHLTTTIDLSLSLSLSLSLHTKVAMVIPLGPGKFYGSSLPRPRFHKDDADRVTPPVPVLDPLLSWANEAHWSMGGLSFQRLRLQGRIEGNVKKLRAEREKSVRAEGKISKTKPKASDLKASRPQIDDRRKRAGSVSPPPAPVATKRRRYMALVDDSEEEEEEEEGEAERKEESEVLVEKKRPARKLYEEFDRVARENEKAKSKGSDNTLPRTRMKKGGDGIGDEVMKVVEDVNREVLEEGLGKKKLKKSEEVKRVSPRSVAKGVETSPGGVSSTRISPRLAKRG